VERLALVIHGRNAKRPNAPPIAFTVDWESLQRTYSFTITGGGEASNNATVEAAARFVKKLGRATTRQIAEEVNKRPGQLPTPIESAPASGAAWAESASDAFP
jgi:hypothetical protein